MGWFPAAGYRDLSFGLWEWLRRLVLPVLALSLSQLALLLRITRTSMLEVLGQEYIVAARAKGLAEGKVIYKHALRNGLMSITTIVGLVFALTLGGSVIIEEVVRDSGPGPADHQRRGAPRLPYPGRRHGVPDADRAGREPAGGSLLQPDQPAGAL